VGDAKQRHTSKRNILQARADTLKAALQKRLKPLHPTLFSGLLLHGAA